MSTTSPSVIFTLLSFLNKLRIGTVMSAGDKTAVAT